MAKKLLHGFPKNTDLIEKINKDILKTFKDHVEWEKYEDSVVYPFWENNKETLVGDDKDFKKWSKKMKKELMTQKNKPEVKPKIDFDTSGSVVTKNDFSKLASVSYLESAQGNVQALTESLTSNFDKALFESTVASLVDDLAHIDPNDPSAQELISQINNQLSDWEDIRNYG